MSKIVASINITLDGFCDHTAGIADEEIHQHFTDLLNNSQAVLYGRVTYQLMESYWPALVKNPTGTKTMDDFAVSIDNVQKIVFSRTLDKVTWKNTKIAKASLKDEVEILRKKPGKDILIGSPSLITSLTELGLVDEFHLVVHPVILGRGLPLFKTVSERIVLQHLKTKKFASGAMMQCYKPVHRDQRKDSHE
jgi:dihydrofolate reductase